MIFIFKARHGRGGAWHGQARQGTEFGGTINRRHNKMECEQCEICGRSIPESVGECTYCNDGIPKPKESIPQYIQYSKVM